MHTYYHITPTRNVPNILRRGLVPARTYGFGLSSLKGADVTGKIFVTRSPEAARDIVSFDFGRRWSHAPDWTVLEIRTTERGRVDPDFGFEDYLYLTRPVPPENIEVYSEFGEEEGYLVPK